VTEVLPALRRSLDVMPSPDPNRPGLLIRDPLRYSDAILIVPPPLVAALACFDGEHSVLDLHAELVRLAGGRLDVADLAAHVIASLRDSAFLEDDVFSTRRREVEEGFAAAERRMPIHAGLAYPSEAAALRDLLGQHLDGGPPEGDGAYAVAAPHVSPDGGWACYAEAYRALGAGAAGATFVLLGTSHYGAPERFGLTRKPYVTPLGECVVDVDGVDRLAAAAPDAIVMEDYCHAVEHSIEFQVLFLQHCFGPGAKVLPVLCGPFARSLYEGGRPEDDPGVARFIEGLRELAAERGADVRFVLGVDMAHVGRRYGDREEARADEGHMRAVADQDEARIARLADGDPDGFWALVQEDADRELKWCGASPLYTFLRAVPGVRGTLLRYQQWNIDPSSVVSFAALSFQKT
jgi:AmmeMemoRadiSam system protein B